MAVMTVSKLMEMSNIGDLRYFSGIQPLEKKTSKEEFTVRIFMVLGTPEKKRESVPLFLVTGKTAQPHVVYMVANMVCNQIKRDATVTVEFLNALAQDLILHTGIEGSAIVSLPKGTKASGDSSEDS